MENKQFSSSQLQIDSPSKQIHQISLNEDQFIRFQSKIPDQIQKILNITNYQIRRINIMSLYCQIAGISFRNEKHSYQMSLERYLQFFKSITVFGGQNLKGSGTHRVFLRLNLKDIEKIQFKDLKSLNFRHCHLNNIQSLSMLDMKFIEDIVFQRNNIVSLKQFRKASFNKLIFLNLQQNNFSYHSLSHLQRFGSVKLNLLWIQGSNTSINLKYVQDLRVFVKFERKDKKQSEQLKLRILYKKQQDSSQNRWKNKLRDPKHLESYGI